MVRRRTSARKKRTAYPALGAAPAKKSGVWVILILGILVVVNLYVFVWDKKTGVRAIKQQAEAQTVAPSPSMTVPSKPLEVVPPSTSIVAPAHTAVPPTVIEGKVGKSDTLGKLLKKNGLSAGDADEVIRALSGVLDFRTIKTGEPFRIERGSSGHVQRFDLELAKGHHVRAERQPSGELLGSADPSH